MESFWGGTICPTNGRQGLG